jgi:hypothetical protein
VSVPPDTVDDPTPAPPTAPARPAGPAESEGRRLPAPLPVRSFIAMIIVVQIADRVLSYRITFDGLPQGGFVRSMLEWGQAIGDIVFLAVAIVAVVIALLGTRPKWVNAVLVAYLSVATINLALNVGSLVATAGHLREAHLTMLWDVGLVYLSTVFVFALWYRLLDTELPGGAFEFPVDPARPERRQGWVDYVFLSFNTNATFGPTSEVVHARTAKVLMMVQTLISLLVLVVLLARIVGIGI